MKKLSLCILALSLIFATSCENEENLTELENLEPTNETVATERKCFSSEILEKQLAENPEMFKRLAQIEDQTKRFSEEDLKAPNGTIEIPVIVHVIYRTNQQNISNAQIRSQIDVLNRDFSATNSDVSNVPSEFRSRVANANFRFTLKQVTRKRSSRSSWGTNDRMKFASGGGVNAIDTRRNLNIWVCNIGGGILGYAQFPGGRTATDGVVISPQYFGTQGFVSSPFDRGRTATHEVGHWLNLRHIWGDGNCNRDDRVADTPVSNGPNYGCPRYPTVRCGSNDMTMNYMDYVDDRCMYMFTNGQKNRMRALFSPGGPRETLL
ncbi:zinc metalloprotease [Aquimarina celericrescens]|uniref:Zinc metalloprotease n=1 Tax=Aquimarina celericrescens TaxID=1964542 RepID=A0ABW5AVZ9_9FLAO|nr:zinc metalloprotease [Aquimarina celericrescens]